MITPEITVAKTATMTALGASREKYRNVTRGREAGRCCHRHGARRLAPCGVVPDAVPARRGDRRRARARAGTTCPFPRRPLLRGRTVAGSLTPPPSRHSSDQTDTSPSNIRSPLTRCANRGPSVVIRPAGELTSDFPRGGSSLGRPRAARSTDPVSQAQPPDSQSGVRGSAYP